MKRALAEVKGRCCANKLRSGEEEDSSHRRQQREANFFNYTNSNWDVSESQTARNWMKRNARSFRQKKSAFRHLTSSCLLLQLCKPGFCVKNGRKEGKLLSLSDNKWRRCKRKKSSWRWCERDTKAHKKASWERHVRTEELSHCLLWTKSIFVSERKCYNAINIAARHIYFCKSQERKP